MEENSVELNTAASVISHISKIEQESARYYKKWSERCEELKEPFLSFVKENKKNEKNIRRVYYGVVSDALETGFAFKGLKSIVSIPSLRDNATLPEIIEASLELEKIIGEFYMKSAMVSKALLADLPRAMERVAKLRTTRVAKLHSLLREIKD